MIDVTKVQPGDTLVWKGKCGEIRGTVVDRNGTLTAMTDDTHGFPIHLFIGSPGARLEENGERLQKELPPQIPEFKTIDEAPVLF